MKIVEARKHTFADKNDNLTSEGIKIAEAVGQRLKKFHYDAFWSAPARRCWKTMRAIGFLEYKIDKNLANIPSAEIKTWEQKIQKARNRGNERFATYFEIPALQQVLKRTGERVLKAIKRIARGIPEEGRVLIVAGGGALIPAVRAFDAKFDFRKIKGRLKECEGIEFYIENDEIIGYKILKAT